MKCECQKNKSGFKWLLQGKKCKECERPMCELCAGQDRCRACNLKLNTILERSNLIHMPEEDLIDLAEANGVTISTPNTLLKSQLVALILQTCQTPKSQEQQQPSLDKFNNVGEDFQFFKLLDTNAEALSEYSVKELLEIMQSLGMRKDHCGKTKQEIITDIMSRLEDQKCAMELNIGKEEIPSAGSNNSDEVKSTTWYCKTNPSSKEEFNSSQSFKNLNILETTEESLSLLPVKELTDMMNTLGMKKHRHGTEKRELVSEIMMHIEKLKQKMVSSGTEIPEKSSSSKMTSTFAKFDILETNATDVIKSIHDIKSLECIKQLSPHELKTVLDNEHINYKGCREKQEFIEMVTELWTKKELLQQNQESISLNDISSAGEISLLRIPQLKRILESHSINLVGYLEKDELAYRVLQLWCEKGGIDEALAGSQHNSTTKDNSQENDISSKKKKVGHEDDICGLSAGSTSKKKLSTVSDISKPSDIESLKAEDLCSILEAHSINYDGIFEKWSLAFRVLQLWYAEKSKENEEDNFCIICMEQPINCTLLECGHTGTCFECSEDLKECPICRQTITRVFRIFKP